MKRFLPQSLVGQIALVMAVALLVAQAINFGLILTERQRLSRIQVEGPAISRFLTTAQRLAELDPERRLERMETPRRRGRYLLSDTPPAVSGQRSERLQKRLQETAVENGLQFSAAGAWIDDTVARPRRIVDQAQIEARERRLQTLVFALQYPDGQWLIGRIVAPRPDPWLVARLAGSTLLLYLLVLGGMLWLARRLARPLVDLTGAAQAYAGRAEPPRVEPRGPLDVQRAILAFNEMGARVAEMLDEKDRMLGAIGHDLRTPLASLRIRAETMEPESERLKIIATIDEMTLMLEDTLALARSGRPREPARPFDVAALVETVVEEFRSMRRDVTMDSAERTIAEIRPDLIRRALRNLIDNGLKYAGPVELHVAAQGGLIIIEVRDRGPGIPPDSLDDVLKPFTRLEVSRNRQTGGSGLGLALARAAAQSHSGRLELENRAGGGLVARLVLPSRLLQPDQQA